MEDHVTMYLDQKKFPAIHTLGLISKTEYCALHFSSYTSSNTETSCLFFYCFKRMTNLNGRKQLIYLCFQHNVRGQARQEKPKTIPRTNPEQLNQGPKEKAPYSCHYIYTSKYFGLEIALKLMRALWLLSNKRIWIMFFSTQMFAGKVFQVIFGFLYRIFF